MKKEHLFFACIFLVFTGCKKPGDSDSSDLVSESIAPINRSVLGCWENSVMFYSNRLIMKENGTFQFYTRTCMGKYYSEGTWQNVGDGYLLTSFDRYKDVKPEAVEPISAYEVGTEQEDELSMENNDTTTKLKSVS